MNGERGEMRPTILRWLLKQPTRRLRRIEAGLGVILALCCVAFIALIVAEAV